MRPKKRIIAEKQPNMGSERFEKAFAKGDKDGSGTIGKHANLLPTLWPKMSA